jgi:hypothetical protein
MTVMTSNGSDAEIAAQLGCAKPTVGHKLTPTRGPWAPEVER